MPTWFDATPEERTAVLGLVDEVKDQLDRELVKDGYNVGETAGQTVIHLPVHVIPRYRGDVPDPTGRVRWVLPGRANYRGLGDTGPAPSIPAVESTTVRLLPGEDSAMRSVRGPS